MAIRGLLAANRWGCSLVVMISALQALELWIAEGPVFESWRLHFCLTIRAIKPLTCDVDFYLETHERHVVASRTSFNLLSPAV